MRRTGVLMLGSQRGPMGGPSPPLGGVQISIFIVPAPLLPQILMCHMKTGGLEAEFFLVTFPQARHLLSSQGSMRDKRPLGLCCVRLFRAFLAPALSTQRNERN